MPDISKIELGGVEYDVKDPVAREAKAAAGGYYTPTVTQPDANTMRVAYTPSQADMPAVAGRDIALPAGPPGEPGRDGDAGQQGPPGTAGKDGAPGVSPTVSVEDIDGGHRVTITDAEGAKSFDVMDGADGSSTLPVASPTQLGGVQPVAKTEDMTNPVGVDESGGLWTGIPQIGAMQLLQETTLTEDVDQVSFDLAGLKRVRFLCIPKLSAALSGWKYVSINNVGLAFFNSAFSVSYAVLFDFEVLSSGHLFLRYYYGSTLQAAGMPAGGTGNSLLQTPISSITQVGLNTAGMCTSGSYFAIWGE